MLIVVYTIALIVLTVTLVRIIVYLQSEEAPQELFLIASILLSLAAIIIRVFIVDPASFTSMILESDIHQSQLKPTRFLNFMPITMLICTTADFLLPMDFVVGMLTFLLAQVLFIASYSGIMSFHPRVIFSNTTQRLAVISTVIWVTIPITLYFFLIFNPADIMTLIVIPYVIVLCLMGWFTYIAFGYRDRPITFRIMLAGGASWFFISDALLAIDKFNTEITIPISALIIGITYLFAVFLLQYAVLFSNSNEKKK